MPLLPRSPITCALLVVAPIVASAQTLETETARFHPGHRLEIAGAYEAQFSKDGREAALPIAIEYGLGDTWQLLVEPVPFTAIRPKATAGTSGIGDLEVTVLHLLLSETKGWPAIALAGEVKIPTAESRLIGTDQTDYSGYLIASRRFGALDVHANLGYSLIGKPPGVAVSNLLDFALGATADVGRRTVAFAEVVGNTATAGGPENSAAPEIAGGELFGTVGMGRHVTSNLFVSLAATYDNTHAFMLRPGFTLRVH